MKTFVATKPGFYDKLRNPGDKFEVPDDTPLGSWVKLEGTPDDLEPLPRPRPQQYEEDQETVSTHEVKQGPSGKAPQTGKK